MHQKITHRSTYGDQLKPHFTLILRASLPSQIVPDTVSHGSISAGRR